jgi:hypothetical protein
METTSQEGRKMNVKFLKESISWRNAGIGTIFAILCAIGFIQGIVFIVPGVILYLYAIRLVTVPVIYIQISIMILALVYSISLSLILTEWIAKRENPFKAEKPSLKLHVFFSMLFVITILDSSLYYLNIIAIVSATLLFWLSRTKVWKILGFIAISFCLVSQIVMYSIFWR